MGLSGWDSRMVTAATTLTQHLCQKPLLAAASGVCRMVYVRNYCLRPDGYRPGTDFNLISPRAQLDDTSAVSAEGVAVGIGPPGVRRPDPKFCIPFERRPGQL